MKKERIRLTYKHLSDEVHRRTGVPYSLIKAILYPYLHLLWKKLRKFEFVNHYYLNPQPDEGQLSKMKPEEVKRTILYYQRKAREKEKRNKRVAYSLKRSSKSIRKKARK
jgi:hypothetical protein